MKKEQMKINSEKHLKRIVKYLRENPVRLVSKGVKKQGRLDSTKEEDQVIKKIRKKFNIATLGDVSSTLRWADFFGETENHDFYPVNIKISALTGADNTCGKIAFLHSFSDCCVSDLMNGDKLGRLINFPAYFKYLKEHLSFKETGKDFYFLVIDKGQTSNVFFTSLRGLEDITTNGSNPPFQCNWGKNQKVVRRSYLESLSFIYIYYMESLGKSPISIQKKNVRKILKRIEEYGN